MTKATKRSPMADAILRARAKRGLTQFEVDRLAGFALGTVAQYECGAREPSLHSTKSLARALAIDAASLVDLA